MKNKKEHNYKTKLEKIISDGKIPQIPGVYILDIAHDDWCEIFKGGICNCNPDIDLVSKDMRKKA